MVHKQKFRGSWESNVIKIVYYASYRNWESIPMPPPMLQNLIITLHIKKYIKVFMPYLNFEYTKSVTHTVLKVGVDPATEFWVKLTINFSCA